MKLSTVFLLAAELLESLPEERVFCLTGGRSNIASRALATCWGKRQKT